MEQNEKSFRLQNCFLKKYKKDTVAIFFSFALTLALMTALLILIHTNHKMEHIDIQMESSAADYYFDALTKEQRQQLISSNQVDWHATTQFDPNNYEDYSCNKKEVVFTHADTADILLTSKLISGRMPENDHEIVAEKWILLNLGVEPECNQMFRIQNNKTKKYDTLKVVGILSDQIKNKKYGLLQLYTTMIKNPNSFYSVHVRFKDNYYRINKNYWLNKLQIEKEQIQKRDGREDYSDLAKIDEKIISIMLLICAIVFYGVYRISLISRTKQYGILRAVGMKRRELRKMIRMELYEIYLICAPVGLVIGFLIAEIICTLSGDSSKKIYLNGKQIYFRTVVPFLQIGISVLAMGILVGVVGYITSRNISKQSIEILLAGNGVERKVPLNFFKIRSRAGRKRTLFCLGGKYLLKDLKTSLFVILTLCAGVTLFTGLAYQIHLSSTYRKDTKEMNCLNGHYAVDAYSFSSVKNRVSRECVEQIKNLNDVSRVKTTSIMPIRMIDDPKIKRNKQFFEWANGKGKIQNSWLLMGSDGTDKVFQTDLFGYNEDALRELKKYVVEGNIDENNMKDNDIILSMLTVEGAYKQDNPSNYKDGERVMDYHVGDKIRIKYRKDFKTSKAAYHGLCDRDGEYQYKTYRVSAIVSFNYMFGNEDCPQLIASDDQVQKICPDSHIQKMYIDGKANASTKEQTQLESKLVRLCSDFKDISARSLIDDIQKNEMLYQKQMVYIIGSAIVALILVLINMINNLKYRMETRTREICMLRAIGMSVKMIKRMMIFENGCLGVISILISYGLSRQILHYLYKISSMKSYGHEFHFAYPEFIFISIIAMMICIILSTHLSKNWKTGQIMERMDMGE